MATCAFPGCVGVVSAKGFCAAHRRQQKLGKDLKPLQQQFHGLTEKERFERWYSKAPNGCWLWLGSTKTRPDRPKKEWHGQWRNAEARIELSNRAAWRLYVGPIPQGVQVLHRCDDPRCVNPDHLFLGTQADNVADMWDKGRGRPGTPRGTGHGNAKLTEDIVRRARLSGKPAGELAKRYGVSWATMDAALRRKTWVHVKQ